MSYKKTKIGGIFTAIENTVVYMVLSNYESFLCYIESRVFVRYSLIKKTAVCTQTNFFSKMTVYFP